jgi:hypothetical protein
LVQLSFLNEVYLANRNLIKSIFNNSICEKNWVYVNYNNSTHVVYNWYPIHICKINNETNILDIVTTRNTPLIFSRVRGSTCGFNYIKKIDIISNNDNDKDKNNDDNDKDKENIKLSIEETEIWFVLHIVSYETPRHYYHLIAVFDESMNLLRYSAPFKFEGDCIEYCVGLVVEEDRVIVPYSTWDRTTKIAIYNKKYIDSFVNYT